MKRKISLLISSVAAITCLALGVWINTGSRLQQGYIACNGGFVPFELPPGPAGTVYNMPCMKSDGLVWQTAHGRLNDATAMLLNASLAVILLLLFVTIGMIVITKRRRSVR